MGKKWIILQSNSMACPHLEYCGVSNPSQKAYNRDERQKKVRGRLEVQKGFFTFQVENNSR